MRATHSSFCTGNLPAHKQQKKERKNRRRKDSVCSFGADKSNESVFLLSVVENLLQHLTKLSRFNRPRCESNFRATERV